MFFLLAYQLRMMCEKLKMLSVRYEETHSRKRRGDEGTKRYTVICCNLPVHVFINCVAMVTKVPVSSRPEGDLAFDKCTQLHLSLFLSLFQSVHFLRQMSPFSPTATPRLSHPSYQTGKEFLKRQPMLFSLRLLLTDKLDFVL